MQANAAQCLRTARLAARLTYRDVATRAGLSWSAIAHFEAGRLKPSARSLAAWRAAVKDLLATRAASITDAMSSF